MDMFRPARINSRSARVAVPSFIRGQYCIRDRSPQRRLPGPRADR
jgi:hypothetical protein